jgi:hypothetical protein
LNLLHGWLPATQSDSAYLSFDFFPRGLPISLLEHPSRTREEGIVAYFSQEKVWSVGADGL